MTMKQHLLPLLFLLSLNLTAQDSVTTELPPLVVDGDPTDTRLPLFSSSITRLTAEDAVNREAHHLQDALGMIPNLTYAGATSRPRYVQLRGVGERSQFSGEGPPNFSVGVVMDDIDLSGLAGAVSLFDVESVDVLRGPQATLYGSRALAGLIRITSTPPSLQQPDTVQFSAGTDDYIQAAFATGGSLSDNPDRLQLRFSGSLSRQNGFRDNVFLGRENTNRRQEAIGRLQVLFQPQQQQRHHLTLMGAHLDNGYDAFAVTGDGFTMYSDEPGEDSLSLAGASLRSEFTSFSGFDLISITNATLADSLYSYDADWGNDDFWAAPPYNFDPAVEGYRYSFTESLDRTREQAGQEFRFQSKPGEGLFDGTAEWSTGLVATWLSEEDDYTGFSTLQSEYEAVTLGAYGQTTTAISENLELISSLRVENRASDYEDNEAVSEDVSDWMWGGRLTLEAMLDDQRSAFAGISRGFKGGGVNANPVLTADQRVYDPESIVSLETGYRHTWADGAGYAALTLFHMWRRDLQIGTSIQPDPSDPTTFTFFTDNAAEGTNLGAEMELNVPVTESVMLFASLGLLDTEYSDFTDAGGNLNVEGREQPYAPTYTFRTGLSAELTERWSAQAEVEGRDAVYFSDSHNRQSDPYQLVHLRLTYHGDVWSVSFWGRNVLDEDYATRGFFFGNEPPDFPAKLWTMKGDPAQFGVTLRSSF
jgi:outer membrane receptor protein involved in Fe transport